MRTEANNLFFTTCPYDRQLSICPRGPSRFFERVIYEIGVRRASNVLHEPVTERPIMDGTLGEPASLLPELRKSKCHPVPGQSASRGFLLHELPRRIRAEKPKE